MRGLSSLLAAAGLLVAAAVVVPPVAQAQPARSVLGAPACPRASSYPPSPDATVESSATVVRVGQRIEVSGVGYCPGEDVDITIHGTHVGTGHTDGTGWFDPSVTVPPPASTAALCGIGASGLHADRDCLQLTARKAGAASARPSAPTGDGGGGNAVTGTRIAALIAVACVLLAIGLALATAGSARRPR